MVERTNRRIALSPSGDKDSSVYFFHIKTKKIIKRNKWKTLPITNEIIESINNISKGEKNIFIFKYQNHTIDETEIFEDKPIINESIDQQYSLIRSISNQNDINLFNDIQQSQSISNNQQSNITSRTVTINENCCDLDMNDFDNIDDIDENKINNNNNNNDNNDNNIIEDNIITNNDIQDNDNIIDSSTNTNPNNSNNNNITISDNTNNQINENDATSTLRRSTRE